MKINLTQVLALKLTIDKIPEVKADGSVTYNDNPEKKNYLVLDSSPFAPVGFGLYVGKTKKTYIIDKRVNGKHINAKVGNFMDFNNISEARDRAKELIGVANDTQRNPNEVKNEFEAAKITLAEAFERYKKSLLGRATPAKPNTIRMIERAERKLAKMMSKQVSSIASQEVLSLFDELVKVARTSCEQSFRWAMAAVKYCILLEEHDAQVAGRKQTLSYNPFTILHLEKRLRTRAELEQDYKDNESRNPMDYEQLGRWFGAVVNYRDKGNRTGGDYLIMTMLLGTRKSEICDLKWIEEITSEEAKTSSWVDLEKRRVFLHDTKNRSDHEMPICDGLYKLLSERRGIVLQEHGLHLDKCKWVFPALSPRSTKGHYSDPNSIFGYIKTEARLPKLGIHDLRRTFGRITEESGVPYSVVKRFLNHRNTSDVTERYTEVQWERVRQHLQKVEMIMLATYPKLHNMLLVPQYQPILEKVAA